MACFCWLQKYELILLWKKNFKSCHGIFYSFYFHRWTCVFAQRIKHLGTKCCSPQSSSGIHLSWLIFLHPEPRSCQTEPIPCCWWVGAAATSCREWPWQWTTPSRQAPCRLKNQHQRDRNWHWTLKDEMSTEGSWPLGVPYQWLGDSPPAPSTLSAELIWHVWRPRAWFASMRALSSHLIYSDQCTLEAWCWRLNPWCSVCESWCIM